MQTSRRDYKKNADEFTERPICPKCRCESVFKRYVKVWNEIQISCNGCNYEWWMRPADYIDYAAFDAAIRRNNNT